MEIYALKAFEKVVELGHLTKASEKLHLSQPALSGQIRALEEELGLALFTCSPARDGIHACRPARAQAGT